MTPRRIAFISEHASPAALLGGADAGGQNVYVDALGRQLGQRGCQIDIFTRRDAVDLPTVIAWAPGVRIINLDAGPARFVPKDDLWPLMPAFRDAMLAFAARESQVYDLVHGHFWMSGWVATELRRPWGVPVAQIFHALGTTKRREQGDADTSPTDRIAVERTIVQAADGLIAQCPGERNELIADYDADPRRIHIIPAAVDTTRFQPVPRDVARRQLGIDPEGPIIVYVGRLLPRKDIRNVVRALALLKRQRDQPDPSAPRLLIVGGATAIPDPDATPEIGELQRLATDLGVDRQLVFAGRRDPEELRDWYSAGDFAVTTPWYEPFGLTPLEAMACGRAVVGAAVGGIAFTVVDGQTGCLVPPRDPEALANQFATLLRHPAWCRAMGTAARERVEREFTWPTTAARVAHLYDELVARHLLIRPNHDAASAELVLAIDGA